MTPQYIWDPSLPKKMPALLTKEEDQKERRILEEETEREGQGDEERR